MDLFRAGIWYFKGRSEYTKEGFLRAAKEFNNQELLSMENKTVAITGGNSGIGLATAQALSKQGAKILLLCRNKEKGQAALKLVPNSKLFIVDLADLKSIKKFSEEFVDKIDVLVNNAGCMINERQLINGVDANFFTNVLGTFYLTLNLIKNLEKSTDPRVITVSSGGMLTKKLDLDYEFKGSKYDGTMVYAQNKRQQVELTDAFATKYSKIFFASMHPGWADTDAVRVAMPDFYSKMKDNLRTADQGADTVVWAACSDAVKKYPSGSFLQDRKAVSKHLPLSFTSSDPEKGIKLFELCQQLASKMFE